MVPMHHRHYRGRWKWEYFQLKLSFLEKYSLRDTRAISLRSPLPQGRDKVRPCPWPVGTTCKQALLPVPFSRTAQGGANSQGQGNPLWVGTLLHPTLHLATLHEPKIGSLLPPLASPRQERSAGVGRSGEAVSVEKYRPSSEGLWVRFSQDITSRSLLSLALLPCVSFSNEPGVVRSQTGLPGSRGPAQGSYGTSLSCSFPSSIMGITTLTSLAVGRIEQSQVR